MSWREFLRANRAIIDRAIREATGHEDMSINDEDRRDFVMNDEGLYLWAKSLGVRV